MLWRARHYDLAWVYMELFPNVPAVFEWCLAKWLCPYVYDCDDAFFHKYDLSTHPLKKLLARKIDRVMSYASEVACGNPYLAAKAKRSGASKVRVIPSVVDTTQYLPKAIDSSGVVDLAVQAHNSLDSSARPLRIGWIGSRTTAKYLQVLAPVLVQLSQKFNLELVVIGGDFAADGLKVTCLPWRKDREIADIQSFDIGVMPLDDTPWELGKCAFKLIQCMACGVPVVGSRVGANCNVVSHAQNGYLASTPAEWTDAFTLLLSDPALRQSIGAAGRQTIQASYSLDSQNQNMVGLFLSNARTQSA
jgi:glycosyltransferase involved in cell wall biosynthesis